MLIWLCFSLFLICFLFGWWFLFIKDIKDKHNPHYALITFKTFILLYQALPDNWDFEGYFWDVPVIKTNKLIYKNEQGIVKYLQFSRYIDLIRFRIWWKNKEHIKQKQLEIELQVKTAEFFQKELEKVKSLSYKNFSKAAEDFNNKVRNMKENDEFPF